MIDPNKVNKLFKLCITEKNNSLEIKGQRFIVKFDKDKIQDNSEQIKEWLNQLDDKFKNGYSFLSACFDKSGNLWTGMHQIVEELFLLGIAIGKVTYCFPRDMWEKLPGGVPYYKIAEMAKYNTKP